MQSREIRIFDELLDLHVERLRYKRTSAIATKIIFTYVKALRSIGFTYVKIMFRAIEFSFPVVTFHQQWLMKLGD